MAHIALTAYELETGGISRVAVYLANGFLSAGHRVSLVLSTSTGALDASLRAELDSAVEIVALSDRRFGSRALGQVATWRALRRWVRTERPDTLLATANNISWYTGLALVGFGPAAPRLFIKITNPILRREHGPAMTWLRRSGYARLFGTCEGVLALSKAEARLMAGQFPVDAARFIPVFNPYLTDAILAAGKAREPAPGKSPLVLALGRYAPQKNFARALRAFAVARRTGKDAMSGARLLIAGEGPQRPELEALVEALDLGDVVTLAPFADDVPALLAQADCYLMSSEYEGLPAVAIEALGSGCPVVTTDCFAAARELLGGLPGCAVTGFDEHQLGEALLASLSSPVDPGPLRSRVPDYAIASAVESHLDAMGLKSPAAAQ